MRRGAWVHSAICGVILMLVFGLSGCWNPFSPGDGNGDGDPNLDRKKPNNLLEFFATAYEEKDLDRYTESLDDAYTFEFDPQDYGDAGVSQEKPYWGLTEDLPRTGAMFTSPGTKGISMDLSQKLMNWIADTFYIDNTPVEGFTCVINPLIDVTIEKTPGEEPVTKQVRKSRLTVAVIPDRKIAGLWTILKITERVVSG
jgi:hypothetical protein